MAADLLEVVRGHGFDLAQGLDRRLQPEDRLLVIEILGEVVEVPDLAAKAVHHVQRRPAAAFTDADERSPRMRRVAGLDELGQALHVGVWNTAPSGSVTPKSRCTRSMSRGSEQRVTTELEEVVVTADIAEVDEIVPDPHELGFHVRSRPHCCGRALSLLDCVRVAQRVTIDLAIGEHGKRFDRHERRRAP